MTVKLDYDWFDLTDEGGRDTLKARLCLDMEPHQADKLLAVFDKALDEARDETYEKAYTAGYDQALYYHNID